MLTPYTKGSRGEDLTGISGLAIHGTGIETSDSFYVLAFIYPDDSHVLYRVSMGDIVFVYTTPQYFPKEASQLQVKS